MADNGYRGWDISIGVDTGDSTKATKDLAKQMRGLERAMDMADKAAGHYEKQQAILNKQYKAGKISQTAFSAGMHKLEADYKRATRGAKAYEAQLKKTAQAKSGLFGKMSGKAEDLMGRAGLGGMGLSGGTLLAGGAVAGGILGAKAMASYARNAAQYQRALESQARILREVPFSARSGGKGARENAGPGAACQICHQE